MPKLSNVAGHVEQCKAKNAAAFAAKEKEAADSAELLGDKFNVQSSRKLMEDYLKRGELNPDIEPTSKGFRRLFAAWILDESLPWTTGEAPSLKLLFQYLKVKFMLPVDTAVRNELASIFAELHGKVVREFAVSSPLTSNKWSTHRIFKPIENIIENCFLHRHLDNKADGLHVCLHYSIFY